MKSSLTKTRHERILGRAGWRATLTTNGNCREIPNPHFPALRYRQWLFQEPPVANSIKPMIAKNFIPHHWLHATFAVLLYLTGSSAAQQLTSGNFTYTATATEVTITGYTGTGGAITIPSSIDGLPVTDIGTSAFNSKDSLTSVTIPSSVITIGNYAFHSCRSLTSITIPNSVTSIGDYAFVYCVGLISVTIPDSVASIGVYAFVYCHGLTSVTIGSGVTNITYGVFQQCNWLTSVTIGSGVTSIESRAFFLCPKLTSFAVAPSNAAFASIDGVIFNKTCTILQLYPEGKQGAYVIPNSVTSIGDSAFSLCLGLISVTISNSVTNIGTGAFYYCANLASVTIPDSVTSIGESVFSSCNGLTSVIIGAGVTSIGIGAFNSCASLTSFAVAPSNTAFASIDGVIFNKAQTILQLYPAGKQGAYVIPNSVTSIGNSAFKWCGSLTSVTIPDSVTSIGNSAFECCGSLTSMTIPNSVTSIGDVAFGSCSGLTSVTIPNSVTSIGNDAFGNCSGLTSVTIPNSVTSIGNSAFDSCTSLTSVTIPASVTSIGERVFAHTGLISVTIPNSVTTIGDYAFIGCSSLQGVTFLGNAPTIGHDAFLWVAGVFSFYYSEDNTGFASPTWQGYPAQSFKNTSYTAWHTAVPAYSGLNPEQLALTADPFGTGVPNLLVYALDLDPRAPVLPAAVLNAQATQLVLTFTPARAGIIYQIHASPDLVTWQIIATITTPSDQPITVADTTLISAAEPRRFLRLSVTQ